MKYYLSSYKFGNEVEKLRTLLPANSRIGHINNARDQTGSTSGMFTAQQKEEISVLNQLGWAAEPLDLREYFHRETQLEEKLFEMDGIWVSGGNAFVLRQAMRLSDFDNIFQKLRLRPGFLYGGYSAGICVLCDSLKYIEHVDNANEFPYPGSSETIWQGLNVFNYGLLPHYNSDHIELEAIGRQMQICIDNKWLFKALRDGEVMILDEPEKKRILPHSQNSIDGV